VLAPAEHEGAEVLKGSARSIAGVDIISIMRAHADLFIKLGGHAMAAGFMIDPENENALREAVGSDVQALADGDAGLLSPLPTADADILPREASVDLAVALERFEPTGAGNPKPVLCIRGQTPEGLRRMGADNRHLKFLLDGLECVMFARGDEPAELPGSGGPVDVYGSLDVNRWNGCERVQMIVRNVLVTR
jgi:single-stranded-DNA-specific exonuclease